MNSVIEAMCDATLSHEFKVNIKCAKNVEFLGILLSSFISINNRINGIYMRHILISRKVIKSEKGSLLIK